MKTYFLKALLNYWPPFLGTGIWVKKISNDYHYIRVEMKMRFWNKNYVGTHFGGSLYAMVDPFYMLMLLKILGKNYIVWDKSANINFIKPGKGNVYAEFLFSEKQVEEIKTITDKQHKYEPTYKVFIKDSNGSTVAEVDKTLYIRKK